MTNYIVLLKQYLPIIEAFSLSLILGIISNYIVYRILKKYYHPYEKPLTEVGKGILISASVIGGIIAFAAQKIFSNLFFGMDLILNKPIKIGDNIVINTESGTIEKITLNQIHLRTWDLRCYVREKMVEFIQNTCPEIIPKKKIELDSMHKFQNKNLIKQGKDFEFNYT